MTEQFKVTAGFRRRADGRLPFYAPGWLAVNEQIRLIKPLIKKYLHGKMADIGCGTKPLQGLCSPYVTEHIGIDHNEMFHDSSNVDIFADAYNIPVPDGYFDCALSTDVFEHLEEPQKAFQETWRILKGGGILVLAVPFQWHLHEQPRDFFRYSRFGLEYLATQAGFRKIVIRPSGGFFMAVALELAYMVYFSTDFKIFLPVRVLLMNVFLVIGWLLNKVDPTKKRLPQSYVCVFRKEKLG